MVIFKQGDMFSEKADYLINTVNCNGVMGKGVALEFKKRWPAMFRHYKEKCKKGQVAPGSVHYYVDDPRQIIVNVATKKNWWEPSHIGWIVSILNKLKNDLSFKPDIKVVMPPLGCGNGGLDWKTVKAIIEKELSGLECEVVVYEPTQVR